MLRLVGGLRLYEPPIRLYPEEQSDEGQLLTRIRISFVCEKGLLIYSGSMELIVHKEVDAFVSRLEKPARSKWIHHLSLLEQYGRALGMPHARKITTTLSEIRIRGTQEVRAFYAIEHEHIFVIHAFVKKTQKIPQHEIDVAEKRRLLLTRI